MGSYIVAGFVYTDISRLQKDLERFLSSIENRVTALEYLCSDSITRVDNIAPFYISKEKLSAKLCNSEISVLRLKVNNHWCILGLEYSSAGEIAFEIECPEDMLFEGDYSRENIISKTNLVFEKLLTMNSDLQCEYIFCDNEAGIESSKYKLENETTDVYSLLIINSLGLVKTRCAKWCLDGMTNR